MHLADLPLAGVRTQRSLGPSGGGVPVSNPKESKIIRIAEGTSPEEATLQFMMNCLLYSRLETGLESNADEYDEDVNVYLAHLLNSFINPRYYRAARRYISDYDTDVFARLESSQDARLRYTIYKTNADYLLLSMGIFSHKNPEIDQPGPLFRHGREGRMGRGKAYYHFAFSYSQRISPRSPSISEVLAKLSRGFEKYVRILSHVRGEYFNLIEHFSEGELFHLEQSINQTARQEKLRAIQDEFLDLYLSWKRTRDPLEFRRMQEVCDRLRELDPTFKFHPSPAPLPGQENPSGDRCTR